MSQVKLLVVEDESIVALDIKQRAESLGYQVTGIAPSGEEALELVAQEKPDLVLMDIVLKGEMDGIETAEQIREKWDLPVIYLTAYSDEKTLERAKLTQPFGYLIKPFEDRDLHSAVEMAIYKHQMDSKVKESQKWLATTLESIGDAVITTDQEGVIKYMNPIASQITGWKAAEAVGRELKEVYHTIHKSSGQVLEDPVSRVISENQIIELSEPALLVTRKGEKLPIDDSSAPIRDESNNIIGVALIFRDIRERLEAERKKKELEKETMRRELFGFVLSALPVFASNIPPQVRDTIARNFADRLEDNMKTQFQMELDKCKNNNGSESAERLTFKCYLSWLSEFLANLGIQTQNEHINNKEYLRAIKCPWLEGEERSPMFCLICRSIVIRSFTWTGLKGSVEQISCMADGSGNCQFQFTFSLKGG